MCDLLLSQGTLGNLLQTWRTFNCSKRVSRYSCSVSGRVRSGLSRCSRYLCTQQDRVRPFGVEELRRHVHLELGAPQR
jgi:hypothetical protein